MEVKDSLAQRWPRQQSATLLPRSLATKPQKRMALLSLVSKRNRRAENLVILSKSWGWRRQLGWCGRPWPSRWLEQVSFKAIRLVYTWSLLGGDWKKTRTLHPFLTHPPQANRFCPVPWLPRTGGSDHQIIDNRTSRWIFASRSEPVAGQKCFLPLEDAGTGDDWSPKPDSHRLTPWHPTREGSL